MVKSGYLKNYGGKRPLEVNSRKWFEWLESIGVKAFRFESEAGSFTARKEQRPGGEYWYAYKKLSGKLRSAYLGVSSELTTDKLDEAVQKLISSSDSSEKVTQNECVTSGNPDPVLLKYEALVSVVQSWNQASKDKTSKDRTWSYALKLLDELNGVIERG